MIIYYSYIMIIFIELDYDNTTFEYLPTQKITD